MTLTQAIDDLHTTRVLLSCRQSDAALAAGDLDGALRHLSMAINRWHAQRFDRMIDDFQTTLRAQRPLQPDHLTDDNYPDSTVRNDLDRVNNELWERDDD